MRTACIAALLLLSAGGALAQPSDFRARSSITLQSRDVLLIRPPFIAAPSADQVAAVTPAGADTVITLRCRVDSDGLAADCHVDDAKPRSPEAERAAEGLSRFFRIEVGSPDAPPWRRVELLFPIVFGRQRPPYVPTSGFERTPTGAEMQTAFGPLAASADSGTATATLDCRVGDARGLEDCRTVSAAPEAAGAALLQLAPRFRVRPWSVDGYPTTGARVRVPLRYEPDS